MLDAPLSDAELRILRALAETALPPGKLLPGAGAQTLLAFATWLSAQSENIQRGYRGLLWMLELGTVTRTRHRFSSLDFFQRLSVLEDMERLAASRVMLRGLLTPLKLAYFDDRSVHAALGCRYILDPPKNVEQPRWRDQVVDASALDANDALECDVVVVGTGAGGAAIAKGLSLRGLAVLLVEEGPYFSRTDFTGRPGEMTKKMYRNGGITAALGNAAILIPVGRGVGGTTLINSGTCFRVPESTLSEWRKSSGIASLTSDTLAPFFEEVEAEIGVAPSSLAAIGMPGRLIAKGCDALGYSHHPLARNAPGCDGQGLCCFGCPTDAKRSTNVSFVPSALVRGAQLVTGLRIDRILVEHDVAKGVSGEVQPNGDARESKKRLEIRAKCVVLACGTFYTPALLFANRLANGSRELGKNLSIHPAASAVALFDEAIHPSNTVPQGYGIDHFRDEGMMFEGATLPLEVTAISVSGFGPSYMSFMEQFDRTMGFGFLIKDTSRGRVHPGRKGEPRITYWLNDTDLKKLQRGLGLLARVYFAAGAKEVLPTAVGFPKLSSLHDVERFEQARLAAREIDVTAHHPLGTARMGTDPLRSVVDATHECWDVHNLFIADGSVLPGPTGVNPQMTIMACALRAAEFVARRAERVRG